MMRHIFLITLLCISFQVGGTIQIDDILITGANTEITISELPLENFENWTDYAEHSEFDGCSASWRGYQARWRILEGRLWLTEIIKNPCDRSKMERVNAREHLLTNKDFPIQAVWYSGSIQIEIDGKYIYKQVQTAPHGRDYEVLKLDFEKGVLKSKTIEMVEEKYAH